jgi:hypothetical protein
MTGPEAGRDIDLERIETALAEGRASADDQRERELQELALALRADSPEPEPRFARELDARVGDGFRKPRRARLPFPGALRRGWMPALAGAAALVAVAVAAVNLVGGGGGSSSSERLSSQKAVAPASTSPYAPYALTMPPGTAATASARRVERSAQITLSAPKDKLQAAADGVGTVAERHGGFVLSSQVNTGDQSSPGGSFVLRVPARELQATLADLSKVASLTARSESGQDVTLPFRQVQDRLGSALIERRALRIRLNHAKGAKADAIRARIVRLSAEIDALTGRMHDLRSRTVYSTVEVTLQEEHGAAGGVGSAWHDSLQTLQELLASAVRVMGVLLPLALLAGAALLGTRTLRRRRREAALF